jgi:hypothetical protein
MLHVDAKGDMYIDATDTLNIADDVVFTADGRIGVGTAAPQTRLHIRDSVLPAIRIADTTEGPGKVLVSDATGAARWESLAGFWYATLENGSSLGTSTGTGTTGGFLAYIRVYANGVWITDPPALEQILWRDKFRIYVASPVKRQ